MRYQAAPLPDARETYGFRWFLASVLFGTSAGSPVIICIVAENRGILVDAGLKSLLFLSAVLTFCHQSGAWQNRKLTVMQITPYRPNPCWLQAPVDRRVREFPKLWIHVLSYAFSACQDGKTNDGAESQPGVQRAR
ncbi:MAG: hypothetical protein RH946_14430 [Rhodospirillales bacterium]